MIHCKALVADNNLELVLQNVKVHCDNLHGKADIIKDRAHFPDMPRELSESIATIVYAAPQLGVDELLTLRKELMLRYSLKDSDAIFGAGGHVDRCVSDKLSAAGAGSNMPVAMLARFAEEQGVAFNPQTDLSNPPPPQIHAVVIRYPAAGEAVAVGEGGGGGSSGGGGGGGGGGSGGGVPPLWAAGVPNAPAAGYTNVLQQGGVQPTM